MSELNAQVTISGSPTLTLEDPGDFELVAVGVGGRQWRRVTVEGRYQHGRALLGAVLASQTLTIQVRCLGASWSAVNNRRQELFTALAQDSYTVTTVIDGVTDVFTAEPADISPASGDTLDRLRAMANMQEYVLTIPVVPGW